MQLDTTMGCSSDIIVAILRHTMEARKLISTAYTLRSCYSNIWEEEEERERESE